MQYSETNIKIFLGSRLARFCMQWFLFASDIKTWVSGRSIIEVFSKADRQPPQNKRFFRCGLKQQKSLRKLIAERKCGVK